MDIADFLDELYADKSGYVYAPVMEDRWKQHFFQWPEEREQLVTHLSEDTQRDVYVSPVLFTSKKVSPGTFKGTNFLWTEFDGNAPKTCEFEPTIKIQSSKEGHEHWYWKLDHFTNDVQQIQDVTKRLAYALEADLSVWDYAVVLRPPNTKNQKRKTTTKVLATAIGEYSLSEFKSLPKPPESSAIAINKESLPSLFNLIAKYQWPAEAYELLTKSADQLEKKNGQRAPDRSAALQRLAFECAEMGMSNEEIFVVIKEADERWGKFTKRTDRERRLEGIISYVRTQKAYTLEVTDQSTVYRFQDFMNTDIKLEWVIPGVLPVAGSAIIFGPAEVGKSTLSLRMGMAIACGHETFLNWEIARRQKVGFVSLEMPHDELKHFFLDMKVSPEEAVALQENFFVWPIGHAYPFDTRDQQMEILKYIDMFGIELLIVDSLGAAMYGSTSSDDDIKRLNSFLNEDLRKARGCGYFFVHHPRKPGSAENKKPQDFYDMFGSIYITNNAQTVLNLNPLSGNKLKMNILKSRLSLDKQSFVLTRNDDRSFTLGGKEEKEKPSILALGAKKDD